MARVTHFEIPVDDPDRARRFYGDVFDWRIAEWGGPVDYWLCTTGPETEAGINGALTRRSSETPGLGLAIGVASLDDTLDRVPAAGGEVLQGRTPIPGVGWLAVFRDPEGNVLSMIENDPGAA